MISILLIVFTLAKGIAEYFSTYLMARIGQSAVLKLRQDLYSHLLRSRRLSSNAIAPTTWFHDSSPALPRSRRQ
jgi:ABC-type multidrug transport system fused ATPase/permease subunit